MHVSHACKLITLRDPVAQHVAKLQIEKENRTNREASDGLALLVLGCCPGYRQIPTVVFFVMAFTSTSLKSMVSDSPFLTRLRKKHDRALKTPRKEFNVKAFHRRVSEPYHKTSSH